MRISGSGISSSIVPSLIEEPRIDKLHKYSIQLDIFNGFLNRAKSLSPDLTAADSDDLWNLMSDIMDSNDDGWIHMMFCCMDCDGGYSTDALIEDLESGIESLRKEVDGN